jgi:hypothetical protein
VNSIAIWWDTKTTEGCSENIPSLHLDVNLWLTQNANDNYIEFGLKVKHFSCVENVFIFLPFVIDKHAIEDKTKMLSDSTSLTNALFNDVLEVKSTNSKYDLVTYSNNGEKFYYYKANVAGDVEVYEQSNNKEVVGSVVKLAYDLINGVSDSETAYTRIRINKLQKLYQMTFTNYMFIDGYAEKYATVEFNLNTVRKLPEDIVQKIEKRIALASLNLFLMTDTYSNIVLQTQKIHASRILENHIWDEYLNNREIDKVIAYHWKEKPDSGRVVDYNLFIKTALISKKPWMLLFTIVVILLLGTGAGIGGNYLTTKCFNGFEPSEKPKAKQGENKKQPKGEENAKANTKS